MMMIVVYLADIFEKLNIRNVQMQGKNTKIQLESICRKNCKTDA